MAYASHSTLNMIYLSCMIIINGAGLAINLLAVVIFIRFKNRLLSVNNNKILFSMALADFFVGLFGIIGSVLLYLYENTMVGKDIMKLFGMIPLFGSFVTSLLTLTILTADRLIAVMYALRYHAIMTEIRVQLLICMTWLTAAIGFIMQVSLYLGISEFTEVRVRIYVLAVFFMVGTFVLLIGNLKLHLVARNKQQRFRATEAWGSNSQKNTTGAVSKNSTASKPLKNMAKIFSDATISFWMTTIFVLCWLPIIVFYVVFHNSDVDDSYFYTYIICVVLAASNGLLNPFVYLFKRKDFRKSLRDLLIYFKNTPQKRNLKRSDPEISCLNQTGNN